MIVSPLPFPISPDTGAMIRRGSCSAPGVPLEPLPLPPAWQEGTRLQASNSARQGLFALVRRRRQCGAWTKAVDGRRRSDVDGGATIVAAPLVVS
eukprot:132735-Chlamydomonas_euryale.AAC.10